MNKNELREILIDYCKNHGVESHEDDFKILCNFIIINNMITFHNIHSIRLVESACNDDIVVWFNEHHMMLSDINKINIHKVRSYL